MQACSLHCAGNGLNFLFAPIVTLATERGCRRRAAAGASAGVLNVVETRIRVRWRDLCTLLLQHACASAGPV